MRPNTQISRGLERLICRADGARLEGMFGMAGMGAIDNFADLESVLIETGMAGVAGHMENLKARHREGCRRLSEALPLAVRAYRLVEENPGESLSGIFDKIKKAVKKVAKVAVKLSPTHQVLKKVAPKLAVKLNPIAAALDPPKIKAKAASDAQAAQALSQAGVQTESATPAQAGAAVLSTAVPLVTPQAQSFAQELVSNAAQPGSAIPSQAMYEPATAEATGTILGMPPLVAAGVGVAALGALVFVVTRRKR